MLGGEEDEAEEAVPQPEIWTGTSQVQSNREDSIRETLQRHRNAGNGPMVW